MLLLRSHKTHSLEVQKVMEQVFFKIKIHHKLMKLVWWIISKDWWYFKRRKKRVFKETGASIWWIFPLFFHKIARIYKQFFTHHVFSYSFICLATWCVIDDIHTLKRLLENKKNKSSFRQWQKKKVEWRNFFWDISCVITYIIIFSYFIYVWLRMKTQLRVQEEIFSIHFCL